MTNPRQLPPGVELIRTTPTFTEADVPAGLLKAHRVAEGVWGRLAVNTGALTFVFEDAPDTQALVGAGEHLIIPPNRPHHLEIDGAVEFVVEFFR